MATSNSNQPENFLAAVGDPHTQPEVDYNADTHASAPLQLEPNQTSEPPYTQPRRLQSLEDSSLDTRLEWYGDNSTKRLDCFDLAGVYPSGRPNHAGGNLTAQYLIGSTSHSCDTFTDPTYHTISSFDNGSVTNCYHAATTPIAQPSLRGTYSIYAPPNEMYVEPELRLTGNEFAYTYSTASNSTQQQARKRRRVGHPPRGEITAGRSSAGNTTQQRKLPENAVMQFRNWMEMNPGMFPNPDEIQALEIVTKVPYAVVHRWFYHELQSPLQTRQETPQVEGTTEELLLLPSRELADNRHENLPLICREASQRYCRNREKCTEYMTDADKERNRGKAWDPNKKFSCTSLCGATFKSKCDWIRHEHNNRPQEGWICDLGETWHDNNCKKCTLCDQSEPDAEHFQLAHKGKVPCHRKDISDGNNARVFLRKDKMIDHLKAFHRHLNPEQIIDNWKFTTKGNFPRRCGFCGKSFDTWEQRNDCIAQHFQTGGSMKTWRDPCVDHSSSQPPEKGVKNDNDSDEDRDEDVDHQDDGDDNDEDEEEDHQEEEDNDDNDDDDSDNEDKGDDHEGGNNSDGGGNSTDHNDQNGAGPEDSSDNPWDRFGEGGSGSGGDGYDPSSAFFDYDTYQNSLALYEVLKHFLLKGRTNIFSSVGFGSELQCQISAFLRDYQPLEASVLFGMDMANSKLSAVVVPQQRIFRGRSLGFGGTSVVCEVDIKIPSIRSPLVLKESSKSPSQMEHQLSLVREFISMNSLRHPHILEGVGLLLKPFECGLVMPMADGSLRDLLKQGQTLLQFSPEDLGCLVSAVAHMHSCDIIHGDIKPENILLMRREGTSKLVLSDFGSSQLLFTKGALSSPGKGLTPKYAAPETANDRICTRSSDMWSLGCVLLELLVLLCSKDDLKALKLAKTDPRLPYYSILPEIHTWLIPRTTSRDLPLNSAQTYTIRRMLDLDAHARPSAAELLHHFPPRYRCCQAQEMHTRRLKYRPDKSTKVSSQEQKIPKKVLASRVTPLQPTVTSKGGSFFKESLSDRSASMEVTFSASAASSPTPFTYRPLDAEKTQIRLLRIDGSSSNNSLHCSLITVDLQDAPEYSALSYVWGDPTAKKNIFLHHHAVSVTKNLYAALQQLRKRRLSRFYWVDALCIVQEDPSEKMVQVGLMSEIYKAAKMVIVWLGDSEPSSKSRFKYLLSLHKNLKNSSVHPHVAATEQSASKELWSALHALVERPWFSRTWVIQEIALARTAYILCGEDELSWQDFADAVSYFAHRIDVKESKNSSTNDHRWQNSCDCVFLRFRLLSLQSAPVFRLHRTLSIFETMRKNPTKMPLMELLERFRGFETTDPRDRVYALLGLACDASRLKISPDYSKSSYEVYTAVAARLIIDYKNLYVLAYSELHGNQKLLPSWVPDWSTSSKTSRVGWPFFSASRASELEVDFEINSSLLYVKGIWVDVLEAVSHPWNHYRRNQHKKQDAAATARRFLLDIEDMIHVFEKEPTDHKIIAEAVWATSNGGLELTDEGKWRKGTFSYDAYIETIGDTWTRKEVKDGSKDGLFKSEAERFHATLSIRCNSRRVFITELGYLGLGPDSAQPGDIVVVLFGANVPLILRRERKTPEQAETFRLVGECYVHGIMDGEIMEGDRETRYFMVA